MSVREKIATNRLLGFSLAAALLVAAGLVIVYQFGTGPGGALASGPQSFFTVDDGQTWFRAPADQLPPFDYQGKPAVRAYVYQCGGKSFVGYLERYNDKARAVLVSAPKGGNAASRLAEAQGREVKRPGGRQWVALLGPAGARVTQVETPAGMSGTPEVMEP